MISNSLLSKTFFEFTILGNDPTTEISFYPGPLFSPQTDCSPNSLRKSIGSNDCHKTYLNSENLNLYQDVGQVVNSLDIYVEPTTFEPSFQLRALSKACYDILGQYDKVTMPTTVLKFQHTV